MADVPLSELREEGWRDLSTVPYAEEVDVAALNTAASFEFVLIGAKRKGADTLQLAAMGRSSEVFRLAEIRPGQIVSGVIGERRDRCFVDLLGLVSLGQWPCRC